MRAEIFGKKAWTLSVWRDEAALDEFEKNSPHSDAMKNVSHQLTGSQKFVGWKILSSNVPPDWNDALNRIGGQDSG